MIENSSIKHFFIILSMLFQIPKAERAWMTTSEEFGRRWNLISQTASVQLTASKWKLKNWPTQGLTTLIIKKKFIIVLLAFVDAMSF